MYRKPISRCTLQAAEALHERPERVLKTLIALVDDKPVCVIIPSDREVAMKKLAAAFAGKSAKMMAPADAERISGYKVGGISPFGLMRSLPTAIEVQPLSHELVFINGGQRGLQVRLDPNAVLRLLGAVAAALIT